MNVTYSQSRISEERRKRLMLGELPDDFLRVSSLTPSDRDQQLAIALDHKLNNPICTTVGILKITVDQAKLTKNSFLFKMHPFVRLRVGHNTYETSTDTSGGKNPRWNEVIQCQLPNGVNSISVEIFDECSFKMDELIAWTQIKIPESVFNGETHEEWFRLSRKQGDGQEGVINLVLSYSARSPYGLAGTPPVMAVPHTRGSVFGSQTYSPINVYPTNFTPQQTPAISTDDLKLLQEIFPNMDKEVVKTVLEANNGNHEAAVNFLLQMSQ